MGTMVLHCHLQLSPLGCFLSHVGDRNPQHVQFTTKYETVPGLQW